MHDSIEFKHVLEQSRFFFNDKKDDDVLKTISSDGSQDNRGHLEFIAGVINRDRLHNFERMLWRVCRGNIYFTSFDIEDPLENIATVSIGNK